MDFLQDSPLLPVLAASCAVGVLGLLLFARAHRLSRSRGLPYPPGPKPELIIGNLRHIPKVSAWETYLEWSKKYNSDVISVCALGKRIVVINSASAASELLDRRGATYSNRDYNCMLQDLMGMSDNSIVFMQYGDRFRLHRKVINTALNTGAVRDYLPIQEKEAHALLERLLVNPEPWRHHLRRMAGGTILSITYGHEVSGDDDYLVTLAENSVSHTRKAIQPASYLVNLIPALKHVPAWFPGAEFQRFAKTGRELSADLNNLPFNEVKKHVAAGTARPSYTTKLLEAKGTITGIEEEEERLIKSTAGIMYGAGSDTSVTSVTNFILAMVLHPEVQKKCQAEIDAVIGHNRLPGFTDEDSLPYLQCVLAESIRWQTVTALGVPHATKDDDVYNGMFIPKGSVVLTNIWAMMHEEKTYPDPFKFWPERFDGRFPHIRHPRGFAFGFNRRLCPGRHLALNTLFITAANMLAVFDFSKARDEEGNEIEPLVDYSAGPPKPFLCKITPRSEAAVDLIKSTASVA